MALYNSLIGTIVICVAALSGKKESEAKTYFNKLKKRSKDLPLTVEKIVDYVWDDFGKADKKLKANLVLIVDGLNVRSPIVSLINEEGNLLPLKPNGQFTNLQNLANEGRSYIQVEYIYDEEGEHIDE